MVTAQDCLKKYGDPRKESHMILYDTPSRLEIGVIPKRVYCNKDMIKPLELAFERVISRDFVGYLKTWDGCFNLRSRRGGHDWSLHAWGIAFDVNAAWNKMGVKPSLHQGVVQCFTDSGFDWGGNWRNPDGMHFQLATI